MQPCNSPCSAKNSILAVPLFLYQLHLSNLARLDMPINTKPTGLSAGGFSMPLVLAILELQRLQIFWKSAPRSPRLRANSTLALRKPSLSPVSWRLPSKV